MAVYRPLADEQARGDLLLLRPSATRRATSSSCVASAPSSSTRPPWVSADQAWCWDGSWMAILNLRVGLPRGPRAVGCSYSIHIQEARPG